MKAKTLVIVLALALGAALSAAAAPATTLDNLQAAYNGESNAHARYLAFAQKADQEGYAGAAALFRAAARAEEIHAANHAVVIKKMGGTPQADVKAPDVKGTPDNLLAAIAGETYERDTMYPEFIKQARADKNKDALETFNYAKSAEAEHARLYTEASKGLAGWKAARPFYVCTICGNTVSTVDFAKCPVCFNPKDKYVEVK